MHRAQPVANRHISEKWTEREYRMHRQRLQGMKPSVDNRMPSMYPHLYQKLKKAQLEEERCSEIERDNRTLVRRMTEIMQRSAIDTRNAVTYKSLNRNNRRKELVRITQENQALLKRIQQSQPTYNHMIWEQQRERSETLCQRICRYPYRPGHGANQLYSPMGMMEGVYYDESGVPAGYPTSEANHIALPPVVSGQTAVVSQANATPTTSSTKAPGNTTSAAAASSSSSDSAKDTDQDTSASEGSASPPPKSSNKEKEKEKADDERKSPNASASQSGEEDNAKEEGSSSKDTSEHRED